MSSSGASRPGPDRLAAGPAEPLVWGSARGRAVVAATVLGSALTFIDATVVTIALPHMGADLGAGTAGLTWVVNGYTLTLAALVLLGGSLGDRFGRRTLFGAGVGVFAVASLVCGLAPSTETLVAARALQGIGGAMLTPGSLAILQSSFAGEDRAKAIGAWSGFAGVAGALGPFVGGWLVQVADWRWVFLVNLPVAAVVLLLTARFVPESRDPDACPELDVPGAVLLAGSLGLLTYALTAAAGETSTSVLVSCVAGSAVLAFGFVLQERRSPSPLLPLTVFRNRLFTATNVVTLLVYAAIGAVFFSLGVVLQVGAGYSPLAAGLALLPVTVLMVLFSPRAGALMVRVGPRLPMTAGLLVAALGVALLGRVDADTDYARDVLGPVLMLGTGLTLMVTPLTATVLAAVPDRWAGLASGVNNAVARTAGLLAVAALPVVAGLGGDGLVDPVRVVDGFGIVTWCCAGLLASGALLTALTVRTPPEPEPPEESHHAVPVRTHCLVAGQQVAATRPVEQDG